MHDLTHVPIPVWSSKGWLGPEHVEARKLANGRFVILCPPRFAYGLAVGDEIELDAATPAGFRVTRHSGNLTVWVYCQSDAAAAAVSATAAKVLPRVSGVVEGTPSQMVIITVPLHAGWSEIEVTLNELAREFLDTSWEFANVYEVEDGVTPLNWWNR
ncbi:MAG: DUF4265 domain-containing protein [Myxococcaceae bacterium]